MKRLPFGTKLWSMSVALLVLACLTISVVAAQEVVGIRLDPVGNSGVSATGSVTPTASNRARVTLDVSGLTVGTSYRALLQAGTCSTPSASSGLLGALQPDTAGRASVAATSVRVSATGSAVDLVFSDLTDGDNIIQVVGADVVACGSIPRAVLAPSQLPATGSLPGVPVAQLLGVLGLLSLGWGLLLRSQRDREALADPRQYISRRTRGRDTPTD